MDTSQGITSIGVPASLLELLKRRYNSAKYVADLWIPIMQASFFYAVPYRNRYYLPGKEFQGTSQNTRVYDTTAVEGVKTFVSKIHDAMTPPQVQWGFLEVDSDMVDDPESQVQRLQEEQMKLNKYMRQLFTFVHASNFDVVINECYYDLSIGTSAIVINASGDDEQPFFCTSIPMDKLAIEEAVNGKIESWFRTWQNLKISELETRWPKIVLSPDLISQMSADPDAKVRNIYEGVAYRMDLPQKRKFYTYAVWADDNILFSEDTESNPAIIWRFQKTNNETWGRGPVMDALPSIISLNEMARIELAAANLNTFKPYMAFSDNVFNPYTFRLEPFSIIPIAPIGTDSQAPLIPLPSSADPNFAMLTISDLRLQIKALLYAETPQDAPGIQPQTAYELSLKQQNLAQKIGPLFSRLQYEFSLPVIKRIGYILHNSGHLPYPSLDGIPIKFKYLSPLALVKGQQEIARITNFVQIMQGIMGPDATQLYINPKTTPYLLAEALQIDQRYLNNPDQVSDTLQKVQNQMSKQQMIADSSANTPEAPENTNAQPLLPTE